MFTDCTCQEIVALIEENQTTAALGVAARAIGRQDLSEQFDDIDAEHEIVGYLTEDLRARRFHLAKQLQGVAEASLTRYDYARLIRNI